MATNHNGLVFHQRGMLLGYRTRKELCYVSRVAVSSVYHLRTLVLGVDNDRIRPTPSNRAIGYALTQYVTLFGCDHRPQYPDVAVHSPAASRERGIGAGLPSPHPIRVGDHRSR